MVEGREGRIEGQVCVLGRRGREAGRVRFGGKHGLSYLSSPVRHNSLRHILVGVAVVHIVLTV